MTAKGSVLLSRKLVSSAKLVSWLVKQTLPFDNPDWWLGLLVSAVRRDTFKSYLMSMIWGVSKHSQLVPLPTLSDNIGNRVRHISTESGDDTEVVLDRLDMYNRLFICISPSGVKERES